jgi:hypothetical protein
MNNECSKVRAEYQVKRKIDSPKESYEAFDLQTDLSYYDNFLENPKYFKENKKVCGVIVEMTPDEYLDNVAIQQFPRFKKDNPSFNTLDKYKEFMINNLNKERIKKLKESVLTGCKLPMPFIDYKIEGQEGRHRAVVARELGIKKIPVLKVFECD